MAQIKFSLGWNRVKPPHELQVMGEFVQCSSLQNFVCRDNRIKKIPGTAEYNSTALIAAIPWVKRSYHLLSDGSFAKFTFCFSDGIIYSGDEVTGNLSSRQAGFTPSAIPLDMTVQVAGRSILYFFTGKDTPYKFDGNGSYQWEATDLDGDIVMGLPHLERAWYIHRNNSLLSYSIPTTDPEDIEDEFIVGNDKDSVNVAIVLGADDSFYIFKNNSIYQLWGRTAATFQVRLVTNKYGLANKRAVYPAGSGFIFLNEFDKELYYFGGTEESIRSLTEADIRLREIINLTQPSINNVCMGVYDGLFRFAFQHRESSGNYNDCELVYPLNEPKPDGLPKWSLIKGSNVLCYSNWNQQDDRNQLITGRSDIGKMMYHGRGWDWGENAMECITRTAEITLSESDVMKLTDIFIKAHPGSHSVNSQLRYYANGRYSIKGEENQSFEGETTTKGTLVIQNQAIFNDNIKPLERFARMNSVSFEIYDYNNDVELEIYSLSFKFRKLYPIRNQLV